ncbi:MAG: tRNA1(Val) (adenine(37)-N6)-methyltransferase [Pseudomonadota bacterium]
MTTPNAPAAETTDDGILNGRLRLLQPKRGHRFGHDAILLAAAVPARTGDRVAEFGAGVGAASLALLARVPGIDVTLFEIDPALCALAQQNIHRNSFSNSARAVVQDVTTPLRAGPFDHILMNPPFNDSRLQPSADAGRRLAHAAGPDLLPRWINNARTALRDGGAVTLIWRAERLAQLRQALETAGFGTVSMLPVVPAPERTAIRVIAVGVKGGTAPPRTLSPLILNDEASRPSAEAEAILRHGAALPTAQQNAA